MSRIEMGWFHERAAHYLFAHRQISDNAPMEEQFQHQVQTYINHRRQHPAWQLLAARSAPLVLGCLKHLLADSHEGVNFETALQLLAELFASRNDREEFGLSDGDHLAQARKELRAWIKRGLVVEREGRLLATDALEAAHRFVESLDNRIMTSTASRLSIVQREIETLQASLNPDPKSRADHIKRQIAALEQELHAVETGRVRVLSDAEAGEGIREIYNLATSLRADFRRVEDSYRDADQSLRQSILGDNQHRGDILDRLLDGHDQLLDTAEGRVFHGFQQQLSRSVELENMKHHLRAIVRHPVTRNALNLSQQNDLRWLVIRLVQESASVIRTRARSERDVKSFLKTGLAAEHHRVGQLLNEIMQQALEMDWGRASVRRADSPLPPVALANAGLPLVERLRFKSVDQDDDAQLDLANTSLDLDDMEEDFWRSLDSLDRQALGEQTLALLRDSGASLDIAALADHLPPTHDLETIALWLSMAREAQAPVHEHTQAVDITDREGTPVRFHVPVIELNAAGLDGIDWEW